MMLAASLVSLSWVLAGPADSPAPATEPPPTRPDFFVRPYGRVGWSTSYRDGGHGLAAHGGARFLLSAGATQRFGVEVSYLDLDVSGRRAFQERYVAPGLVLEMTLFRHFLLGIGTIGYVGVAGTRGNPFGVVTNLGWEPLWDRIVLPFVTLRTEWIFERRVFNVTSLSLGITFRL